MRLKDLQEKMLIPDREVLINGLVKMKDYDVLLISITAENRKHRLWTLHKLPEQPYEDEITYQHEETLTNREIMQQQLQWEATIAIDSQEKHISQMIIQGQIMTFNSSESMYAMEHHHGIDMKLQHFVEKGLDLECFAETRLDRLSLTVYEQDDSERFPEIDLDQEFDITLKFNSTTHRVPIHTEPIVLEFGNAKKEIKHSFYDSFYEKKRFFYIDALTRYDLWKEREKELEQPISADLTEEEWQQFKEDHFRALETLCSRKQDLALVEYESENNIQLNFYMKHHLDAAPLPSSNGVAMSIMFSPDHEFGHNGFKSRIDSIGPVDKAFEGSIVIELLSYYVELPEKIIKL
ncbi:hypothetical protein [Saccharibacillus sacchari]|uniref:hypothetical protein n=1 Tax=Saccharibacillus sacchari TaxID=456493 RepID=UPI0004AEDB75|nr:hypothetical protein [Saccharibacillus sacchari]